MAAGQLCTKETGFAHASSDAGTLKLNKNCNLFKSSPFEKVFTPLYSKKGRICFTLRFQENKQTGRYEIASLKHWRKSTKRILSYFLEITDTQIMHSLLCLNHFPPLFLCPSSQL